MTQGVFQHEGTRYCLVPRKRPTAGSYWPGGPSLANPISPDGVVIDPAGRPIENAVAILEDDLWVAGSFAVTIRNWPVYPFASAILKKLPPTVVERLIESTVVHQPNASGEISVEIGWDQLRVFKVFTLIQVGAGVGVWPPRVLADWTHFYFMLATGDVKLAEKRTEVFSDFVPLVFGYDAEGPRRGETHVTRIREAAFARIDVPPRWLTFCSAADPERTHGILPIRITQNGELTMPDPSARVRSSFASKIEARRLAPTQAATRISLDFGTSNSAVAVLSSDGTTQLLPFDASTKATNLTRPVNLDPTLFPEYTNRFFSLNSIYPNPIPTLLFEAPDVDGFAGSDAIPVRGIPAFTSMAPRELQIYAAEGYLKQDFKWNPSGDSATYRRAFLEQLATIVAWALRTNPSYSQQKEIDLVFSCPLAFTPGQTTRFRSTIEAFVGALRSCGLSPRPLGPLVSESLANLRFVRETRPTGRLTDSERHVVVDIGGGTTDISVFTGTGRTVLLDSLYIGGKDIAGSLLRYRIAEPNRWQVVAQALGLAENNSPKQRGDERWVAMAQCLLINRMASNIDQLADELGQSMPKLLSEMLALLTFVSLYAIRMSAVKVEGLPPTDRVNVWFAGLGARLFNMAPLAAKQMDRQESARKILARAVQACPELSGVGVTFMLGKYSKESVCRGALLAEADNGLGDELTASTLMWADVPSANIDWAQSYQPQRVAKLTPEQVQELQTKQLSECYEIAVRTVGELTLDKFRLSPDATADAAREVGDAYARGCDSIRRGGDEAPRHPVFQVTEMMKTNVCELMD